MTPNLITLRFARTLAPEKQLASGVVYLRMERIAFKMKLFPGLEKEYKKRHDEIWDDMKTLLKEKGVRNFSIFLDEETNILFAYLETDDPARLAELPGEPVQKKWWAYMKDIMQTNDDNSPFRTDLKEMFYFP